MRHHQLLPHPFIFSFLLFILLLSGLPTLLFAQNKKPSKKELNVVRIDSIFSAAERIGLNTQGILRYEFLFSDPDQKRLLEFSTRMEKDSFELGKISTASKVAYLSEIRNATYSRTSMYDLEHRLRGLKYQYYINHYLGFSIHPADLNPLAVTESEFNAYLKSLSDEQLFWVGNRLLNLESYHKALLALEMASHRQYKPDSVCYRYGTVLVATNDPGDGINQWKKAIKLNPNYLDVFLDLGEIHFQNGYFEDALRYYQRADTLHSNDSQILFHIGEILYLLERYNQSYSFTLRAHQLDHKNVYAKSLLKSLNDPGIKHLRKKYPDK